VEHLPRMGEKRNKTLKGPRQRWDGWNWLSHHVQLWVFGISIVEYFDSPTREIIN
jgi:hypothetical protein